MSFRACTRWLAVSLAAGVALGCERTQEPAPDAQTLTTTTDTTDAQVQPPPLPPAEPATPGHLRMVAVLKDIADATAENNYILGDAPARKLREQVADLPADAPIEKRAGALAALADEEVRLGNMDRSVELYEQALGLARSANLPPQVQGQFEGVFGFRLAVAYMRAGETRNCVGHMTPDSCMLPIVGGGVHMDKAPSRQAIAMFEYLLPRYRENSAPYIASRWLLNIAYMTIGGYPDEVPAHYLIAPQHFTSAEAFPKFPNIAGTLGVGEIDLAGGAACEDFDGDGDLDIIASTWDPRGPMRVYRNNADGTFTEISDEAGLKGITGGLNLSTADYDNDGDVDLLVLRGAWMGSQGRHPNSLLRNDGHMRFTDVTFDAGLAEPAYPCQVGVWADYDNDGDMDLYTGNENRSPCQLFRNNGDGTFTDVAEQAGVTNMRWVKGAAWGDCDGDRLPDLYVSNFQYPNRLYHNNGDGTFTDVAEQLGVEGPNSSFVPWFWDFDNDGALDLMVNSYMLPITSMSTDVWCVAASILGIDNPAELPRLYKGDGRGGFTDVADDMGLGHVTMPMAANFGDLDNDGFLDFYLGTGYPGYDGLMPNRMYHNLRGQRFSDVTFAGGFGHLQKGHGISFADLDNDGDEDVYEQMGGFLPGDIYANALYENPGFEGNWIKVRLVGETSNRFGIGARITLHIVEDGQPRAIHRWVGTGASFGCNPMQQHIGTGKAETIQSLEIYWPTSDTTQRFENVAVKQAVRITEGQPNLEKVTVRRWKVAGTGSDR